MFTTSNAAPFVNIGLAPPQRQLGSVLNKLLLILVFLGVCGTLAFGLLVYNPSLKPLAQAYLMDLFKRAETLAGDSGIVPGTPQAYKIDETSNGDECPVNLDDLFGRYHALGESYLVMRDTVADSNTQRELVSKALRTSEFSCHDQFKDINTHEISRLRELPIDSWFGEASRLSVCIGQHIAEIEAKLGTETESALVSKLVQNADRTRLIESDLVNITRDLAYLRNKSERLIEAYNNHLLTCSL